MNDRRLLFIGVVLGVMLTGCGDPSRAAAPPAPPPVVKAEPVVEQDVPISAEWVGTLAGSINAQIRARVAGHLMSQHYAEGAVVKAGDLLFQVDPRPYQTAADAGGGQAPSGAVPAQPGEGPGDREPRRKSSRRWRRSAGRGAGQEGRGRPAPDGARRRPLCAAGRARLGQPTRTRQRGPEQPREPRRAWRRRARCGAELAGQRVARAGGAREGAGRREDPGGQHRGRAGGARRTRGSTSATRGDRARFPESRASVARTSATTSARTIRRR